MIPCRGVSVSLSATSLRCTKAAERIEVLFAMEIPVLDEGPDPPTTRGGSGGENFAHCKVQEYCSDSMRPSPDYLASFYVAARFVAYHTVPFPAGKRGRLFVGGVSHLSVVLAASTLTILVTEVRSVGPV